MADKSIRVYGSGPLRDEGGAYHIEHRPQPAWVSAAQRHCAGCHDDFYNGRANCTGNAWCLSLKRRYARRKTRPPCYH